MLPQAEELRTYILLKNELGNGPIPLSADLGRRLAEAMTAAESCASSAPTSKEFHSSTDVGRDASERTLMSSMVKRQASGEVDEVRGETRDGMGRRDVGQQVSYPGTL